MNIDDPFQVPEADTFGSVGKDALERYEVDMLKR